MKSIIVLSVLGLSACATNPAPLPHWNLPEETSIAVSSISYAHGGIDLVQVVIDNRSGRGYCISRQIYSGKPSQVLASDLIRKNGAVIPFEARSAYVQEDNSVKRIAPNETTPLTLNYAGQYAEVAPNGTPLRFRVVLPVQRCDDEDVGSFRPDIVLVSDFQNVIFIKPGGPGHR